MLFIKQLEATAQDDREFGLCPSCGKPLSKNRDKQIGWAVNTLCLLFALVALALVWYVRDPSPFYTALEPLRRISRASSPPANILSPSDQAFSGTIHHNTRRVTFEQYLQLKTGMSDRAVSYILGSKGKVTSRTQVAGVLTEVHHWQNPDGSNLSVEFRRGELAVKARFKLELGNDAR